MIVYRRGVEGVWVWEYRGRVCLGVVVVCKGYGAHG